MSRGKVGERPSLDAWQIMAAVDRCEQPAVYRWSFSSAEGVILNDRTTESTQARRTKGGALLITGWPYTDSEKIAVLKVVDKALSEQSPFIALLSGPADKSGTRDWRFFCPVTRTLVQMLYFDPVAEHFCSRRAIGRPRRPVNFEKFEQAIMGWCEVLERREKFLEGYDSTRAGAQEQLAELDFDLALRVMQRDFMLNHLDGPYFFADDFFVPLPSRKRSTDRTTQQSIYSRSSTGDIKLTRKAKKRLGML